MRTTGSATDLLDYIVLRGIQKISVLGLHLIWLGLAGPKAKNGLQVFRRLKNLTIGFGLRHWHVGNRRMLSHTSKMSARAIKMNPPKAVGVKGSDVYTTTGDPRVDLSTSLVRGLDAASIQKGLDAVLGMGTTESFEDAFVMTFQTRNIRGGKGERELSKEMLKHLLTRCPELTRDHMLDLVPKYGCWRDLFAMAADPTVGPEVRAKIWQIAAEQLRADTATEAGKSISLCAKWAPREDKMPEQAKVLARLLFPEVAKLSDRLKSYRKYVVALNKRLDTTEIKMCGGDWEEIEPGKVPGRNLHIHRRAFLNEVAPKKKGEKVVVGTLRHPDDESRMACREHFTEFFAKAAKGEVKVKGADTLYPHEVITKVLQHIHYGNYRSSYGYYDDSAPGKLTESEQDLLRGQWRGFVDKAREGGALKNCLAMCDFSGSMDGLPKQICMALGLLVSEVNGTNKILTFDSVPQWHQFPEGDVFQKAASISASMGQGLSTDFQKAMELVLADIKARRVRPEDLPKDLIVFTDMGWDSACGSNQSSYYTGHSYRHNAKTATWQTHLEMIRENFRRAGEDMWGAPFVPPRIVVWNLRAEYKDCHATADQEGVVMLSGWSPALFKVLQEKGVEIATPLDALRALLDDPMYDVVRERVRAWNDAENRMH